MKWPLHLHVSAIPTQTVRFSSFLSVSWPLLASALAPLNGCRFGVVGLKAPGYRQAGGMRPVWA